MNAARFVLTIACCSAVACGPKDRTATPPGANASADAGSAAAGADAGPEILQAESEIALRTRTLAALDAGDVIAADRALREIVRRRSTAIGARGIIDALERCALKDNLRNCNLANLTTLEVTAPPPPATVSKERGTRITAKPVAREDEPNPAKSVFETRKNPGIWYIQRGLARRFLNQQGMPKEKVDWLPSDLGDSALVLVKWTGARWLAVYGRTHNDGRFVVLVDSKGVPERILDFRAWRAHNALVEVGIRNVDMVGDTLYVKQESNASDGFVAAVDTNTGKTLWQSERLGMSSQVIAGDEHVVVWTYSGAPINGTPVPQGFRLYDRATGEVVARIPTSYVIGTIIRGDGSIYAYGGGPGLEKTNRVEINTPAKRVPDPPPTPEPPKEGTIRLATLKPIDPALAKARLDAFGVLDEGRTLDALVVLRDIYDKLPSSIAAQALFDAARIDAAEQREAARIDLTPKPGTVSPMISLATPVKNRTAPIKRTRTSPPKLKLLEEKEVRTHRSAWFFDAKIPANTYEQDERPNGVPILPAPLWLPSGRTMDVVTPNGDQTVAVYSAINVCVFRSDKLVSQLTVDRTGGYRVPRFADAVGNVVFVSLTDPKGGTLVAADLQSGSIFWKTDKVPIASFVIDGGYIIAITQEGAKKPEYLVIEGDTGKVVSRTSTPKGLTSFASRLALWQGTLYSFNDIMTARFSVE